MNPTWTKFGFTEADVPYLRHFETMAANMGWSAPRIEAAYSWYSKHHAGFKSSADVVQSFQYFASEQGWDELDVDMTHTWIERVANDGPAEVGPGQLTADDERREAAIKQTMRRDMQEYRNDPTMERELYEINERRHASGKMDSKPPLPTGGAAKTRIDEIREVMKTDIHQYYGKGLDTEYQALMANETNEGAGHAETDQG